MIFCTVNKFRLGLRIINDGEPCIILHKESVKPGKGQAFTRVRLRKLLSNRVLEKVFKSNDSAELADIKELSLIYLYNDSIFWYFMDSVTFDQIPISFTVIQNYVKWLIVQLSYNVMFWNNNPISVIPPNFIELKVIDTHPCVKGDTVSSSVTKLAILSTGLTIKVPLFIQEGEYVKVDTRSGVYVSRIK